MKPKLTDLDNLLNILIALYLIPIGLLTSALANLLPKSFNPGPAFLFFIIPLLALMAIKVFVQYRISLSATIKNDEEGNNANYVVKIWIIPYRQNNFFTGRDELLQQLHDTLKQKRSIALTGKGGIGKTQIAIEYAYRYKNNYLFVLWANATDLITLGEDFIKIARELQLPQEPNLVVESVRQWLNNHSGWLFIFDNTRDVSFLKNFLPQLDHGHLLFTSRHPDTGAIAESINVGEMNPTESRFLLLRRAKILPSSLKSTEQEAVATILEALGGLPLALDQAGAYMEKIPCLPSHYLKAFQKRQQTLLETPDEMDITYFETVATTWTLNFDQIRERHPAAADLLCFLAFLAPNAIPEELLIKGANELGPHLQIFADDETLLDNIIGTLSNFSLIQRNTELHLLFIHRLVQTVFKSTMALEIQNQWAERTVKALKQAFSSLGTALWSQPERYLPHIVIYADLIEKNNLFFSESAHLLDQTAFYLYERVQYLDAIALYRCVLAIREHIFGPSHPDTALSLNNLAFLYDTLGKKEAEPLYQRALTIREHVLGPHHPDTVLSLNNLATCYNRQGKYEQAQPLLERVLAISEQVLSPDHPDTARSLNNLGVLYNRQGKYEQAQPLLERALAIRKQLFGRNHPDTASSFNNLAFLYESQGKYEQAEALYKDALAIREQILGRNHPDTASSFNILAVFYNSQGKYEQAEALYKDALAIREQILGSDHPDTVLSLDNLALLYRSQGKYKQAEALYRRVLAGSQRTNSWLRSS